MLHPRRLLSQTVLGIVLARARHTKLTLGRTSNHLTAGVLPAAESHISRHLLVGTFSTTSPPSSSSSGDDTMAPPRPPPNTPATPSTRAARPPPMPPRLSSSLLLLDSQNRVLLVQRSHSKSMSFSSAIVFPGGNLDPGQDNLLPNTFPFLQSSLPTHSIPSLTPDQAQIDLPPEVFLALKICAIRECFEETGVLLARAKSTSTTTETPLSASRALLLQNKTTFSTILASHNLSIDPENDLLPFTTWITPTNLLRRYRTQMFLSFLPDGVSGQLPPPRKSNDGPGSDEEIIRTRWVNPEDVLSAYYSPNPQNGEKLILFPPQVYLLTILSGVFASSATVEQARKKLVELAQGRDREDGVALGKYVMMPYQKMMDGEGRPLIALDKPRGDRERWVRAGKGPVEIVKREDVQARL